MGLGRDCLATLALLIDGDLMAECRALRPAPPWTPWSTPTPPLRERTATRSCPARGGCVRCMACGLWCSRSLSPASPRRLSASARRRVTPSAPRPSARGFGDAPPVVRSDPLSAPALPATTRALATPRRVFFEPAPPTGIITRTRHTLTHQTMRLGRVSFAPPQPSAPGHPQVMNAEVRKKRYVGPRDEVACRRSCRMNRAVTSTRMVRPPLESGAQPPEHADNTCSWTGAPRAPSARRLPMFVSKN